MFGNQDNLDEQLTFLAGRPTRSGKQARIVRELDAVVPQWGQFIGSDRFKHWLLERNAVTGVDRATMFSAMFNRRDEKSLAIMLRLYVDCCSGLRQPYGSPVNKASRFRVGDLIVKNYEIICALGAGGFGEVFLVVSHEEQHFDYGALKLLRLDRLPDASTRNRFVKEARVLMELSAHPHVVPPMYIERVADSWAIISEYVLPDFNGRSMLSDHIAAGSLTIDQRATYLMQICAGLASTYKDGLAAHRDLKPTNILIDSDGRARVMDFGLASLKEDKTDVPGGSAAPVTPGVLDFRNLTVMGSSFGTPAYMPPEQFISARECDERSDVYSLGVILYEMTAGKLPFLPGNPGFATFAKLHSTAPVPPLRSRLWPIIDRCMRKRPEDRYQSVVELATAIRNVCEATGIQQGPIAVADRQQPFAALVDRGHAFSRLNEHEKAVSMYRQAIDILDLVEDVWCRLAFSLNALARYEEALEAFSHTTSEGRNAGQEFNLGLTYFKRSTRHSDRTAALKHFKSSALMDPDDWHSLSMVATCELSLERPQEALQALTACAQLPGTSVEIWLRKLRLEVQLGQVAHAEQSRLVVERNAGGMNDEQRAAVAELDGRLSAQSLALSFKRLLGPGFTAAKCEALALALLDERRRGTLSIEGGAKTVRTINAGVLFSQAEDLCKMVLALPG
jgi:eukaryotic-like serine/threonine-protein kinase